MEEKQLEQFRKDYEALREKYGLPTMDELNKTYNIEEIVAQQKHITYPLRVIRKIMTDYFYSWINYLHNFILPSTQSAIIMKEYEYFNDKEKEEIIMVLNRLVFATRQVLEIELKRDEASEAQFIKEKFQEWNEIKEKIKPKVEKIILEWKKSLK